VLVLGFDVSVMFEADRLLSCVSALCGGELGVFQAGEAVRRQLLLHFGG
jgi:hypothetical protein